MFMQKRSWLGKNKAKLFAFIVLLIVSLIFVLPLIYGVFGSFRKYDDFMYFTKSFLPSSWDAFTLDGYKELFSWLKSQNTDLPHEPLCPSYL